MHDAATLIRDPWSGGAAASQIPSVLRSGEDGQGDHLLSHAAPGSVLWIAVGQALVSVLALAALLYVGLRFI
jgi:hypothetical protein